MAHRELDSSIGAGRSYIRGAAQRGEFHDSFTSTISSFQPQAVSTCSKGLPEYDPAIFDSPKHLRLSISQLSVSDNDGRENGDASSVGILRDDKHFKALSSLADRNGFSNISNPWSNIGRNGLGNVSFPSSIIQNSNPDFSAELAQKSIRDNLAFIAREEAQNQAAYRFVQEDAMMNDRHCETSSWSVQRALEDGDEEKARATLLVSTQSPISASSFFQVRSGPLGQLDGSNLENEQRPVFGMGINKRKIDHECVTAKAGIGIPDADETLQMNFGNLENILKADGDGVKETNDRRSSRHSNAVSIKESSMPRLTSKPPRVPSKLHAVSSMGESAFHEISISAEKSTFNAANGSNILSSSKLRALCDNLSVDDSPSMLANEVMAYYEHAKKEKASRKKDTAAKATNAMVRPDTNGVAPSSPKKDVPHKEPEKPPQQLKIDEFEHVHEAENRRKNDEPMESGPKPPMSKLIEIKIDGVLYKGTVYAEPN